MRKPEEVESMTDNDGTPLWVQALVCLKCGTSQSVYSINCTCPKCGDRLRIGAAKLTPRRWWWWPFGRRHVLEVKA